MRELTFPGFLRQYVRQLSLSGTGGLYKLAAEAASDNPRLREPLLLYALLHGKEDVLLAAAKSPALRREYEALLARYDRAGMETALKTGSPALPPEYTKVYHSYLNIKNRAQRDNHTKELMRQKILQLQREKHISTYRLYTDLHLNPGNVNAYLKHGDCGKVSVNTARTAVTYLEQGGFLLR